MAILISVKQVVVSKAIKFLYDFSFVQRTVFT